MVLHSIIPYKPEAEEYFSSHRDHQIRHCFLWIKSVICKLKSLNLQDVQQRTTYVCHSITPEIFEKVRREIELRLFFDLEKTLKILSGSFKYVSSIIVHFEYAITL